jgi:thiosulfate/3-mercaptopyruvate sulfurtransferase
MSWRFPCVVLAVALLAADKEKSADSLRAKMLIEAEELARPEVLTKSLILDTRSKDAFKAGHIPQALHVDTGLWDKTFAAFAAALPPAGLEDQAPLATGGKEADAMIKVMTDTGLFRSQQNNIVVYGDDLRSTARIWWILRYWGQQDVRILNGGWKGWQAAKNKKKDYGKRELIATQKPAGGRQDKRLALKSQVLEALKKKSFQIVDARSEKEFCGRATTARRNGSIPAARHLEWSDLIDGKTERFKTKAELNRLFRDAGIDLKKPTMTYCQSGGRAAVMAFALELMGAKDVRNYYRSWAEWGNDEKTPIVQPKK